MAMPPAGMILAAGLGTRLKPLTDLRPKPLMEIANKPIIYYLINNLIKSGVRDIYINLYYKYEQLIQAIHNFNFDANINFSIEEEILGTAGGVRRMINKYDIKNQELIVVNGDIWCDFDSRALWQNGSLVTLVCALNHSVQGYEGCVAIDEDYQLAQLGRYYSNNNKHYCRGFFTGLQILSEEALKLLSQSSSSCLVSELYPQWLREGRALRGHMLELSYEDLGSPERLLKMNSEVLEKSAQSVLVHPSAIIEEGVSLGPRVSIGAGCTVKTGAHIKDSLVMSHTTIEKDERLDCAIALLDARVLMKGTY